MKDTIDHYYTNFEVYEEEARKEWKASIDWELARRVCAPRQIEAIELFAEHLLFEGAASIAGMSILEFVQLLRRLAISRA